MGNFISIVGKETPSSVAEGSLVDFYVRVKNLHSENIHITVSGAYNSTALPSSKFLPTYALVSSQETSDFSTSFLMPGKAIWITIWSWYWGVGDQWILDDQGGWNIALEAEEPPNGEPPNGEPPDDEKSWFEKNKLLVIGGIAGVTVLGIVLVRK